MNQRLIQTTLKAIFLIGIVWLFAIWISNRFRITPKCGPGHSLSRTESIARGTHIADLRADSDLVVPWGGQLNFHRGWVEEVLTIKESWFWGWYEAPAGYYSIVIPIDDPGFAENTPAEYLSFSLLEYPGRNAGIHTEKGGRYICLPLNQLPESRTVQLRVRRLSLSHGEFDLYFENDSRNAGVRAGESDR